MTWIAPALYAEGPTDYRFLRALLDTLLPVIAEAALPEIPTVGQTITIDAPAPAPNSRAERIVAAIAASYPDECNLFIVHADGDSDPEGAKRERVNPGFELARSRWPDIALAACVPVREIEAWMLVDPEIFVAQLGHKTPPVLPRDPEGVSDSKRTLTELIAAPFKRRPPAVENYYEVFGNNVRLDALRRLPAFRQFESNLVAAIRIVARPTK